MIVSYGDKLSIRLMRGRSGKHLLRLFFVAKNKEFTIKLSDEDLVDILTDRRMNTLASVNSVKKIGE